jgi:hypothetical protein
VPSTFIEAELAKMSVYQLAQTANRSVVGMLNEFAFLAETFTEHHDGRDLVQLSKRLAHTPCGPLRSRSGFPDVELAAVVASTSTA